MPDLSSLPEFSNGAEVAGLLRHEAENVWSKWNPYHWSPSGSADIWAEILKSGCEHLPAISQLADFLRSTVTRPEGRVSAGRGIY
jgi:hypothetical protein